MNTNIDLIGIVIFLAVSLLAGLAANALAGKRNSSLLYNFLLGAAGAFTASLLLPVLGLRLGGLFFEFIGATLGALLILTVWRFVSQSRV